MSEYTTVARPYAKAAFEFAVENNCVEQWQQMLGFLSAIAENEEVKSFLLKNKSPEKAVNLFLDLCGDQLDQHGKNFVHLMAENRRLVTSPDVLNLFNQLLSEYRALADVEVISAKPLSEQQKQNILQAMERKLARKVKLNCSVDESLIGGVVIRADDLVIDGSCRGKLARLANELQ